MTDIQVFICNYFRVWGRMLGRKLWGKHWAKPPRVYSKYRSLKNPTKKETKEYSIFPHL